MGVFGCGVVEPTRSERLRAIEELIRETKRVLSSGRTFLLRRCSWRLKTITVGKSAVTVRSTEPIDWRLLKWHGCRVVDKLAPSFSIVGSIVGKGRQKRPPEGGLMNLAIVSCRVSDGQRNPILQCPGI